MELKLESQKGYLLATATGQVSLNAVLEPRGESFGCGEPSIKPALGCGVPRPYSTSEIPPQLRHSISSS
jgi:hypothetical protein